MPLTGVDRLGCKKRKEKGKRKERERKEKGKRKEREEKGRRKVKGGRLVILRRSPRNA
jgi:hypothetical protein